MKECVSAFMLMPNKTGSSSRGSVGSVVRLWVCLDLRRLALITILRTFHQIYRWFLVVIFSGTSS